jgi:hypothetical protein
MLQRMCGNKKGKWEMGKEGKLLAIRNVIMYTLL